jgi:hypothetical protein
LTCSPSSIGSITNENCPYVHYRLFSANKGTMSPTFFGFFPVLVGCCRWQAKGTLGELEHMCAAKRIEAWGSGIMKILIKPSWPSRLGEWSPTLIRSVPGYCEHDTSKMEISFLPNAQRGRRTRGEVPCMDEIF